MVRSISNMVTLLLWIQISSSYGQTCPSNKYGSPQCQYDCHCASNVDCDPSTGCSNVGPPQPKCAPGWDGDTCQRQNVALGRPAQQSSIWCYEGKCYPADNAVDGNVGHSVLQTPCTHTLDERGAAWTVTLAKTHGIYRFTIYNRKGECCADRLNGFQLSVGRTSDSDNNYRLCYTDKTTSVSGPGDVITRTCNSPIYGDLVQVKLQGGDLTLCEVLIYVCSPGWYGGMCSKECVSADKCSRCTANQLECAECNSGKWGADCNRACGSCWNSKQCDKEDGVCPKTASDKYRCSAGFKGDRCILDCTAGSYGPDCQEPCGLCRAVSPTCAKGTGVCPITAGRSQRCSDGYKSDLCKEICSPGQYGGDCREMCGQCAAGNQSCAKDSGVCPENSGSPRCSPGYKGDQCKDRTEEQSGDKDTGPALIGGIVGGVIGVALSITVGIIWKSRNKLCHQKKVVARECRCGHDLPQQGSVTHDNSVTCENFTSLSDMATYKNERTVLGSESLDMAAVTGDLEYETVGDDNYARLDMSNQKPQNNDYAHLAPSLGANTLSTV